MLSFRCETFHRRRHLCAHLRLNVAFCANTNRAVFRIPGTPACGQRRAYLTQAPLCSPRRHQPGIALYTPKRWTLLQPTPLLHGPRHTHIHQTGAGARMLTCKDDNACKMTSQNVTHVVESLSMQDQSMQINWRGERTIDVE